MHSLLYHFTNSFVSYFVRPSVRPFVHSFIRPFTLTPLLGGNNLSRTGTVTFATCASDKGNAAAAAMSPPLPLPSPLPFPLSPPSASRIGEPLLGEPFPTAAAREGGR